jgi:hypothetical protein
MITLIGMTHVDVLVTSEFNRCVRVDLTRVCVNRLKIKPRGTRPAPPADGHLLGITGSDLQKRDRNHESCTHNV